MLKAIECMNVLRLVKGGPEIVTVVSGLPRSGTSMMMRILHFAGFDVLTDHHRQKDESNPYGYFEFEPVKETGRYTDWMKHAEGKAVKLVSRFLPHLPATHRYKVVFMHREIEAVIRSQQLMAKSYSGAAWDEASMTRLKSIYLQQVESALSWVAERPNIELLELHYEEVLASPSLPIQRVAEFLSPACINVHAMMEAVDPQLNHAPTKDKHHA